MLATLRRRIPPASSTTIVGVSTLVGVASSILLRRLGYPEEAGLVVGAAWAIIHPQVDRSVPVAELPPHAPLPEALASPPAAEPRSTT